MKSHPILALDIGSTKVACAAGLPREHTSGFELLGSSLVPYPSIPEGWLADPLMVSRTIEQALEATAVTGDFDCALVTMTHPSLSSERVRVSLPLGDEPVTIRAQDLDRLQASALHQVLGVDREPLLVERLGCAGNGFEGMRDPRGLSATRLVGTFHILTMPMAARRAIVQVVEGAGLEVVRVSSTLPALLGCAFEAAPIPPHLLIIDAGGLTTTIGLFVEGVLYAAHVLPWGGLSLARAVAKEQRVTMDQALTWSLEGAACRKPLVRSLIERQRESIGKAIDRVLKDQPRPDAAFVSGRGALIDGFVEWVERTVGTTTTLCRSARTSALSDLSRQVGLSTSIGLLALATRSSNGSTTRPSHLVNRLIDRTRTILTEYF